MIKRLLLAVAMLCAVTQAQVPVTPIVQPHQTFVNAAGLPCAGCQLFSYIAGTTIPQATYTDSTGTSQNPNPIVLDASGGPQTPSGSSGAIWVGRLSYKFILKDSLGATIWSVDNVNEGNLFPSGPAGCVQISNLGVTGMDCDANIYINKSNHTLNVGTIGVSHVVIGPLGTPTLWTFDTTTPATALASLGGAVGGTVNTGTINQLAFYAAAGNTISGTSAIPSAITATTQSPSDNTTKLATTAYVETPGVINPTSVQVATGVAMTGNQGNGAAVQHSTGTTTTDDCAKFDANGNTVDAGHSCLTAVPATQTDVTGLRALGTPFQNTTTVPMFVQGYIVTTAGGADGQITCSNGPTSGLGNSPFSENPTATDAGGHAEFHLIVPPSWFYECTASGTMNPTLGKWFETVLQ